jgi:hypothetical protein
MSVVMSREADAEVELATELAYFAKELGVLPVAGGLFDQPYYYMMLIKAGLRAFEKKQEHENSKAKSEAKRR